MNERCEEGGLSSMIPETQHRSKNVVSEAQARPAHREGMRHYGVLLRDIALGFYEQWTVIDADSVRIVSPVALNVEVEGVGTVQDESFMYPYSIPPSPQGVFSPNLQGGVGGATVIGGNPIHMMPAGDWLIDRPVAKIRFPQTRDTVDNDWRLQNFPNAIVHLFVMRGNVRNLGFGRPIPHSILLQADETGTAVWMSEPIRPTIHGDNLTSGQDGMVPLRTEITGFSWNFSFQLAGSGLVEFSIYHRRAGGALLVMGRWFPPVLAVGDQELSIPLEFSPLQCRQNEALDAPRGALQVGITANNIFDGGYINLRMRSYM